MNGGWEGEVFRLYSAGVLRRVNWKGERGVMLGAWVRGHWVKESWWDSCVGNRRVGERRKNDD